MINAQADEVLKAFLQQGKIRNQTWNLKKNKVHRLIGSFIWNRAVVLTTTGPQHMTPAQAQARITTELGQVLTFVDDRLGANRHTGPLAGGPDPGVPPHLDLTDLAKQQVTDLTFTDLSVPGAKHVRRRRDGFVRDRRNAVLTIIWRAAALERELWELGSNLVDLDQPALSELLDRRLRVVERMAGNVSAIDVMREDNPKSELLCTDPDKGWRDGLRVRMFEYPQTTLEPKNQLGARLKVGPTGDWQEFGSTLNYNVAPPPATRVYNNNPADTETWPAKNNWRFPSNLKDSWVVSVGRDSKYRIDLIPAGSRTGTQVMDLLFSYQSSIGGEPERADFWNRTWLLCDMVISALQLEGLLFGLRRREHASPPTDVGRVPADPTFNAQVALRPPVVVHRPGAPPSAPVDRVQTGFVSLDAHLQTVGNVDETSVPDPKVLMNSKDPAGTSFADSYFRNRVGRVDEVQVGDWVKANSSPAYYHLTAGGVWGLENALIMDVDPDVDNALNRGGVKLPGLMLQGHGLIFENYNNFRDSLGDGLTRAVSGFKGLLTTTSRPIFPVGKPDAPRALMVEWAPYDALAVKSRADRAALGKAPDVVDAMSGPWWVAMAIRPLGNTPEEAIAAVPGAVGKPQVTLFHLRGDPTTGMNPADRKKYLFIEAAQDFFDHFILFPILQPVVGSGDERSDRLMWESFFHHRQLGLKDKVIFHFLVGDQRTVPGFASSSEFGAELDQVPMIQPRPRRSRNP